MNDARLITKWKKYEEDFAIKGWDFSHIENQWDCPEPPWKYRLIVQSYLKDNDLLLDMGTGGGEVLRTINHPYTNTYVTEAYAPNFELCKSTLSPLGITLLKHSPTTSCLLRMNGLILSSTGMNPSIYPRSIERSRRAAILLHSRLAIATSASLS